MASNVSVQRGICYEGMVCDEVREAGGESKFSLYAVIALTITIFLAAIILTIVVGQTPSEEVLEELSGSPFGFPYVFM